MKHPSLPLLLLSFAVSCAPFPSDIVEINDCEAQFVYFDDVATDVRIVPLEVGDPLMGAYDGMKAWGNEVFMLTGSFNNPAIMYFVDGKLVSTLDRNGRIDEFTYCPESRVLTIRDGEEIKMYKADDMSFIGSAMTGCHQFMAQHDPSTLLMASATEIEGYERLMVDARDGRPGKTVIGVGWYSYCLDKFGNYYRQDNRVLSVVGNVSRIYKVDENGDTALLLKYRFPKMDMPEKYCDFGPTDDIRNEAGSYLIDNARELRYGGEFCQLKDSTIAFWYNSSGAIHGNNASNNFIRISNGKILNHYRGFWVKGLHLNMPADCISGNDEYVVLVYSSPEKLIDEGKEPSPIGKRILEAMECQPDGVPILVYYKIK